MIQRTGEKKTLQCSFPCKFTTPASLDNFALSVEIDDSVTFSDFPTAFSGVAQITPAALKLVREKVTPTKYHNITFGVGPLEITQASHFQQLFNSCRCRVDWTSIFHFRSSNSSFWYPGQIVRKGWRYAIYFLNVYLCVVGQERRGYPFLVCDHVVQASKRYGAIQVLCWFCTAKRPPAVQSTLQSYGTLHLVKETQQTLPIEILTFLFLELYFWTTSAPE